MIGGIETKAVTLIVISILLVMVMFSVTMLMESCLLSYVTQEISEW